MAVDVPGAVQNMKDAMALIQKWAEFEQYQPFPTEFVDKIAANVGILEREMEKLSGEFVYQRTIFAVMEEDANTFKLESGNRTNGEARMNLLVDWIFLVEKFLTETSLTMPVVSEISSTLPNLLRGILPSFRYTSGFGPRVTAAQVELEERYIMVLNSIKSFRLITATLNSELVFFTATAIPLAADVAAEDFFYVAATRPRGLPPRETFKPAQQAVRMLTRSLTMLLSFDREERTQAKQQASNMYPWLDIIEDYFYTPKSGGVRRDMWGTLQCFGRRQTPIYLPEMEMFGMEEIGGIRVGVLATAAVLKASALQSGPIKGEMEVVERRVKSLKRYLDWMWQRELRQIEKINWLNNPCRAMLPSVLIEQRRMEKYQSMFNAVKLPIGNTAPSEVVVRGGASTISGRYR